MPCLTDGTLTICRPTVTDTLDKMLPCPACREPEHAVGTFAEWYGWTIRWDCGTVAQDGEWRRPREMIVDEHMRRPEWLLKRDRGW